MIARAQALILRLSWALVLILGQALGAGAQSDPMELDYDGWRDIVMRSEEAVRVGRASTNVLEELRVDLVEWRQNFQEAQDVNSDSITATELQIESLGVAPEDGEEPSEISAQRRLLVAHLTELTAPRTSSEIAYRRADTVIKSIDKIIRDRQTSELLHRGPSPLNPALWPKAFTSVTGAISRLNGEIKDNWNTAGSFKKLKDDLPEVVVLLMIALVLLARGRRWSARAVYAVQHRSQSAARWILGFLLSLGQVILPLIGAAALYGALVQSSMFGPKWAPLLEALFPAAVLLFVAAWLGGRLFPRVEQPYTALQLPENTRSFGRLVVAFTAGIAVITIFVQGMAEGENWSAEIIGVVQFPLLALMGYGLYRLALILRAHQHFDPSDEAAGESTREISYSDRMVHLVARAVMALAIAGPVLAALGYNAAAHSVLFSTFSSLLLLAFLLALQRLCAELYVLMSGNRDSVRDGLLPVLTGFVLLIASVPLFALIWGMRVADLSEIYARVSRGVSLGGVKVSPSNFITFAVVFTVGYLLTRLVQGALKNTVLPKTKMDIGARNALVSGLGYVGIFLAALAAITSAGIDLSSLAIVAGALSVGIGFGLQNIVSNFVSGIILLIERPISEGDWIEVGGQMGYVRDISVRSTRIETFDRTDVIVPNSDLISGTVTNYTRGNTVGRVIVPVGVAYGTDPRKVESILREIANAHPMVLAHPAPSVIFQGFGADSLDFEIRAILRDVNWVLSVKSDMNYEINERFVAEGIEIPFAQRDVWLRNPETLQGAPEAAKAAVEQVAKPAKAPKPRKAKKTSTKTTATSAKAALTEGDVSGEGDGDR